MYLSSSGDVLPLLVRTIKLKFGMRFFILDRDHLWNSRYVFLNERGLKNTAEAEVTPVTVLDEVTGQVLQIYLRGFSYVTFLGFDFKMIDSDRHDPFKNS